MGWAAVARVDSLLADVLPGWGREMAASYAEPARHWIGMTVLVRDLEPLHEWPDRFA